jgi:hypothetical protein
MVDDGSHAVNEDDLAREAVLAALRDEDARLEEEVNQRRAELVVLRAEVAGARAAAEQRERENERRCCGREG